MNHKQHKAYQALCDIEDSVKETFREMLTLHRNTLTQAGMTSQMKGLYDWHRQEIGAIEEAKQAIRSQRSEIRGQKSAPLRIGSVLRKQIG